MRPAVRRFTLCGCSAAPGAGRRTGSGGGTPDSPASRPERAGFAGNPERFRGAPQAFPTVDRAGDADRSVADAERGVSGAVSGDRRLSPAAPGYRPEPELLSRARQLRNVEPAAARG